MRKSLTWLRSSGLRLLMVGRPLLKLLRRSMSTRRGHLSSLARCSPQCLSSPCSSLSLSNCNKRKRRRRRSSRLVSRNLSKDSHLLTTQRTNGSVSSAISREESNRERRDARLRFSRPSSPQQEVSLTFCQDQTPTCHPTCQSQNHTDCLLHSSQANQVPKCATWSNHNQKRSNTDRGLAISFRVYLCHSFNFAFALNYLG